jgi:hypothetical protein
VLSAAVGPEGLAMLSFVEAQHGGAEGVAAKVYRDSSASMAFPRAAETTASTPSRTSVMEGARSRLSRYATDQETQEKVRQAVRLGVTAYTLEWDGHVQAMTGQRFLEWSRIPHCGNLASGLPRYGASNLAAA